MRFNKLSKALSIHTRSTTSAYKSHQQHIRKHSPIALKTDIKAPERTKKQQHNNTIDCVPGTGLNYSFGNANFIHRVDTEVDLSFGGNRLWCRSLTDISFDSDYMSEGKDSFALENYSIKAQKELEDIKERNELELLEGLPIVSEKRHSFRFAFAGRSIPRRGSTGEDAFYTTVRSLGVADGVSGWYQYGLDSAEFSRQLMQNCKRSVLNQAINSSIIHIDLMRVLTESYEQTHAIGSSTATLVAINDNALHGLNLGDSGFICFTKRGEDYICHGVTKERQHNFNTPFQLSNIPTEEDIEKLKESIPESDLEQLVSTIARHDMCQDPPNSADRYILDLHENDIIILGTDGNVNIKCRIL